MAPLPATDAHRETSSARLRRGATADISQLRSGWQLPKQSTVLKGRGREIARPFHRPSRTNYFHPHPQTLACLVNFRCRFATTGRAGNLLPITNRKELFDLGSKFSVFPPHPATQSTVPSAAANNSRDQGTAPPRSPDRGFVSAPRHRNNGNQNCCPDCRPS